VNGRGRTLRFGRENARIAAHLSGPQASDDPTGTERIMTIDARPTISAPDDDPYLWLEEIESERALAWVEAQNAATMQRFGTARFAADRDTLKEIFDRPDNIPFPSRRGKKLFNGWQDAKNPRGLWRTTSLASFRRDGPDWDVLIDVDALAANEGEDWVWHGGMTLPGTHDRAIVHLSRGGSDAVVLREFDLTTRAFVADGFRLPEAKSSADWLDRDTLLLSSPLGEGMATRTGYGRTVRLWRRGTDPLAAPVIFATREDYAGAWAYFDREATDERIWFLEKPGFLDANLWVGDRTGPKARVDIPSDAMAQAHRDWLAVKPRTPWTIGETTHAPDTVLAISLPAFLAGDRGFTTLFEPGPRRALQGCFWCGGRLVLWILDDLKPLFEVLLPSAGEWRRARIKGLPEIGSVNVWPFDQRIEESNGDLLALAHDPLTPPSLYLIEPDAAPALLKRAPQAFDSAGHVITRHEAVSSDGEQIPYVQVGPPGETGDAPVHMYGYGGFGASVQAYYNSAIGKLWLERGGTSVVTHLRGGAEFGTAWHEAARRAGRRLAHDDFAAVAADLVRRGVTRPGRIAAEGGSNGGLLIANMLTRYPERFGALFCTVPVIDMRRSAKLLEGAWWIDEYGDPDNPDDWKFLAGISAYHVAAPGKRYPPILLATSRRDDRVHPAHARKMAMKLQAMGCEAYFYEPASGGHAYGKDNQERATFTSLGYTFLREKIGWAYDDV
jgi:prolyl oligopeptidase